MRPGPCQWMVAAAIVGILGTAPTSAQTSFVTFESGPVRPLALSPDGSTLFAVNSPDNRLEIFDVVSGGVTHRESVPVGMEPVAVAARTNSEVWVVNHLSDSVSIVDVSSPARVVRTLLVGDEPNDVVFAGPGGNRAFITTAHRGQHSPYPRGEYTTPGIGRADVWVFNASNPGGGLGGTPLTIVTLFGDKPRALAVSPDGSRVFAAILHSGNQTTAIAEPLVCDTSAFNLSNNLVQGSCTVGGATMPGGIPLPHRNHEGFVRPETGLILKLNRDGSSPGIWQDELGRNWNNAVKFDLPDLDVFAIDANANPPVDVDSFAHVGTVLFNMVVNPANGNLYVSNTDAQNHVRFEGPGILASGFKPPGEPATVRGHLAESRITVIDALGNVVPRHLNKHIDYSSVPQPAGAKQKSLATPLEMAVTPDGTTLYVAAFGSAKIGVFNTAALENDTFVPNAADHIELSGGGPAGVVLDGDRLYTLTRFNNAVVVVDLTLGAIGQEIQSVPLHNPEPQSVVQGRPFLYDAMLTGSNGESSCASCHIFGDFDGLGWDLGNPDDDRVANGNPFTIGIGAPFHPQKGPMTTQSLRGLVNMGPQHWRGDRQGNSVQAFNAFNVAFPGLVGRDEGELSAAEMQKFTDFVLQISYPPNPGRQLDNSLRTTPPSELAGRNRYFGAATDGGTNCNGCHTLDPANGFFGGNGNSSFEGETQEFKIAHLRNVYQKIGMFGLAGFPPLDGSFAHTGPQVRGFAFLHDGAIDTLKRFLNPVVFSLTNTERDQLEAFMIVFDTDLPPAAGQQITRTSANGAIVDAAIDAAIALASSPYPSKLLGPGATMCDLVVKGVVNGEARGYLLDRSSGRFRSDRAAEAQLTITTLRALANTPGQELTFTCAPFGSGLRMGIDRDQDAFLDRDEIDAGSDPADPLSIPTAQETVSTRKLMIQNRLPDDETKNKIVLLAKDAAITTPPPGTSSDPRCGSSPAGTVKASLTFFSTTSGQAHTTNLPCENWTLLGTTSRPRGYKYQDRELDDGTARRIIWKNGSQLNATLQGKGPTTLEYDLQVGITQGAVGAAFDYGGGSLCMACAAYNGKDGSDGKVFLGKSCVAPPACPTPNP
jgi:DNA-binding beta-propeller fold protein YncE